MITEVEEKHYLTCGCCGKYYLGFIPKDKDGVQTYDNGVGMCPDCGGDPKAKTVKKRMGWAACTFYEARFDLLRNALGKEAKAKFDGLSYQKKCFVIQRMLEKGFIKW